MRNHPRPLRFAATLAIGFGVLFACSCAPRTKIIAPELPKLAPIEKVESPRPAIARVQQISAESNTSTTRAADAVDRTATGLVASKAEMESLVAEAARLVKKQSATETELSALYRRLVEEEKRRGVLLQDVSVAKQALNEAHTLNKGLAQGLVEAEQLASAKDLEVTRLRDRLEASEATNNSLHATMKASAASADEAMKRADTINGASQFKTRLLITLGVIAVIELLTILFLLRSKLPV